MNLKPVRRAHVSSVGASAGHGGALVGSGVVVTVGEEVMPAAVALLGGALSRRNRDAVAERLFRPQGVEVGGPSCLRAGLPPTLNGDTAGTAGFRRL